jgi:hypothetical protein
VRDHPQHLLTPPSLGSSGSQMAAKVPLHHAVDRFHLGALAVWFAFLRSVQLFFIIRRYLDAGGLALGRPAPALINERTLNVFRATWWFSCES